MNKSSLKAILIFSTLFFICSTSYAPANDKRLIPFIQYHLSNGLWVILAPDNTSPNVTVSVTYDAGSRRDPKGKSGLAHFCEHLMFKGSANVGQGEHMELIRSTGGYNNGLTSKDSATYYDTVPANQCELALYLEADHMRSHTLKPEHITQVRNEVLLEKLSQHDGVSHDAGASLCEGNAYNTYAYQHTTIGEEDDIKSITLNDVETFFNTYYVPNHAAICVCGSFDVDTVKVLIEKDYSSIPSSKTQVENVNVIGNKERVFLATKDHYASTNELICDFTTVPVTNADNDALILLSDILCKGQTSRLYKREVNDLKAIYCSFDYIKRMDLSLLTIRIGYPTQCNSMSIINAIDNELYRIAINGVSSDELEKACNMEEVGLLKPLTSTAGRACGLSTTAILEGDPERLNTYISRLRKVSVNDIKQVADVYLKPKYACNVISYSYDDNNGYDTASIDRKPITKAIHKDPSPSPSIKLPEDEYKNVAPVSDSLNHLEHHAKYTTLPNGMQVVYVEDHRLPLVFISTSIDAGIIHQPSGCISYFTRKMLTAGTKNRTEDEIQNLLSRYGAKVDAMDNMETTRLSIYSRSNDAYKMIGLIADMLQKASFPEKQFNQLKSQELDRIADIDNSAFAITRNIQFKSLAPNTRYAQQTMTRSDILKVQRRDLISFYNNYYLPNRTVMVIVGDFDINKIKPFISNAFKQWKSSTKREDLILPSVKNQPVYLVNWRSNKSTYIKIYAPAPRSSNKDYIAFVIADHILAAEPYSRMQTVMRNKLAKTYIIRSDLFDFNTWSLWTCLTSVKSEYAVEAYKLINDEIARLRDNKVSDDELKRAKRCLMGKATYTFESYDSLVDLYTMLCRKNMPKDDLIGYYQHIDEVTAADIQSVAKRYLSEESLGSIIIGPRDIIEAPLSKLHKVECLDDKGGPFIDNN